jgi:hypothetical protein
MNNVEYQKLRKKFYSHSIICQVLWLVYKYFLSED